VVVRDGVVVTSSQHVPSSAMLHSDVPHNSLPASSRSLEPVGHVKPAHLLRVVVVVVVVEVVVVVVVRRKQQRSSSSASHFAAM